MFLHIENLNLYNNSIYCFSCLEIDPWSQSWCIFMKNQFPPYNKEKRLHETNFTHANTKAAGLARGLLFDEVYKDDKLGIDCLGLVGWKDECS
jgi:hypothetical protein